MSEEEQVIRDWLAGQLSESGGPLPPARRRSQPLPRRQVVAVVATLIEEIDRLRAAPRAATEPRPDLREYLAANLFDGDGESGVVTAPIKTHLDDIVEIVIMWLDAAPRAATEPGLVLVREGTGGVFPDGTTNHPPIDFEAGDKAKAPFDE